MYGMKYYNAPDLTDFKQKWAPYAVPAITVGGFGFLFWGIYRSFFKGKDTSEGWNNFIGQVEATMVGGLIFVLFTGFLVGLQKWFMGATVNEIWSYYRGLFGRVTGGLYLPE